MKINGPVTKKMTRFGAGFFLLSVIPLLGGCASHDAQNVQHNAAPGSSLAQLKQKDIQTLEANGVQVIRVGETYRLVIPSDDLFNPNSANLSDDPSPVLNTVARLLNVFHP